MNYSSHKYERQSVDRAHIRHRGLWALAWAQIRAWHARSRQRRALATLDAHLLNDIGIPRTAANAEAAKPFWRD